MYKKSGMPAYLTLGFIAILIISLAPNQRAAGASIDLLSDSTFSENDDSANLRSNSVDQDWYESRDDVPTLLSLDQTNIGGNIGKKAALLNYGIQENAYLTQEFAAPQTGVINVSFDIFIDRIENTGTYDRTGHIYIGDNNGSPTDVPTRPSDERFVFLAFYDPSPGDSGNDLQLRARESTSQAYGVTSEWTIIATGLSYDNWYSFELILDVLNGNYDVYLNGIKIQDNVSKYSSYDGNSVDFITFSSVSDGRGDFYLDNVYASTQGIPEVFDLTIYTVGEGSVTRNPNQATYTDGTVVTLTANPGSGYVFSGWSGDMGGSINPVTIVMNSGKTVTATFTPAAVVEVIYDDDEGYWTVASGGSGSIGVSISEETGTVTSGSSSLGYGVVAGSNQWVNIQHSYSSNQDWSDYSTLTFYWYGRNTGANLNIYVEGGDWSNRFSDSFVDNFNGWRRVELPLSGFDTVGSPSWSQVRKVQFTYSGSVRTTWFVDKLALESGSGPVEYSLSVSTVGSGSVSKSPNLSSYVSGTVVTLTANPGSGYVFSGWSGAVSGSSNPVYVTMNSDKTVTATFTEIPPTQYTLTVNTVGSGSVSKSPNLSSYVSGTVVTLTANPGSGYVFSGWSGDMGGSINPVTIVMNSGKTVTATFTPAAVVEVIYDDDEGYWTVASGGSGSIGVSISEETGTVTSGSSSLGYGVVAGSNQWVNIQHSYSSNQDWSDYSTLTFYWYGRNTGANLNIYVEGGDWSNRFSDSFVDNFNGWRRVELPLSGFDTVGSPSWSQVRKVQFTYSGSVRTTWFVDKLALESGSGPVEYSLSVSTVGSGSVSKSPNLSSYVSGTVVTLTANPGSGYVFSGWSGAVSGSSNPVYVTMNSDKTVTATFTEIPPTQYTLTVNTVGSGSVSKSPNLSSYVSGTVVTLTANPGSGYVFSGWSGDMGGSINPVTIVMNSGKTVTATFTPAAVVEVIYDDDEGYWTVASGGSGSIGVSISEETGTVTSGSSSLGYGVVAGSNQWVNIQHSYSSNQDWSDYSTLTFYWYGRNTGANLNIYVEGGDWSNRFSDSFVDNFNGWRRVELPLSGFDTVGSPSWSQVRKVQFTYSGSVRTTWFVDKLALESGSGPVEYSLSVSTVGSGSVSKSPNLSSYVSGTVVTLTANPGSGYVFSGWSGAVSGSSNPVYVTMNSDKTVTATFTSTIPSIGVSQSTVIENLYGYSSTQLREIAEKFNVVTTHAGDHNEYAINTLRQYNPDIIILMYRNVHAVDSNFASQINIARSNGWILKDIYGNEIYEQTWPEMKLTDVGNVGYQIWLAEWIQENVQRYGFDGIWADNTSPLIETMYGVNRDGINPRTGNIYTDNDYRDDMVDLVLKVKQYLGNNLYVGNGVCHQQGGETLGFWNQQSLVEPLINVEDGIEIEGFIRWASEPWRSYSSWIKDIDALEYISKKGILVEASVNLYGTMPSGATKDRVAMFGLTSFLLGSAGPSDYVRFPGYTGDYSDINIGYPVESYHVRYDVPVYEREYNNALVIVNPRTSGYTVSLGGTYRTLQGSIVSSIYLADHTGIILMKVS